MKLILILLASESSRVAADRQVDRAHARLASAAAALLAEWAGGPIDPVLTAEAPAVLARRQP